MEKFLRPLSVLLAAVLISQLAGCSSVYYATYEKFGVYKRDLLKKRVIEARDDQKEAQVEFKSALTRLKEITHFDGGNLEKTYNSLKGEYDTCSKQAEVVHKRIREVEAVAADMFAEWDKENGQISTPALRDPSRQQLVDTKARYAELHNALVGAEQAMTPVLRQYNDYVLYLKHDLNAMAIDSLKIEAASITTEINRLIDQMNESITRADDFVKGMK